MGKDALLRTLDIEFGITNAKIFNLNYTEGAYTYKLTNVKKQKTSH